MKFKTTLFIFLLCVFIIAACTMASEPQPTPTPTIDSVATEAAQIMLQATENAQRTAQAEQTALAQQTTDALATLNAQATLDFQATENAITTATQKELDKQATATQNMVRKITSTAQTIAKATEQARPMFEWVQKLFEAGKITTNEGIYYAMEDFDLSWAEIGYGRYFQTGYTAEYFLLQADIKLTSASDNANWQDASCGFIFGEEDNRNYDLADVAMDGNIYMWNCRGGSCRVMAVKRYGNPMVPQGQVSVLLSVFNDRVTFYVDGEEIVAATDTRYERGKIAYLLRSGTNKDYGTRCQITNVGLWMFP